MDLSNYNVTSFIGDGDDFGNDLGTKYYCNYCHAKISYNGKEPNTCRHEFLCARCNIAFYPANELVRKANKFETPGEQEPLNATVDSNDNNTLTVPPTEYFARRKK